MQATHRFKGSATVTASPRPELKEVVMGLHWDPPAEGSPTESVDLDALCLLFDDEQHVLDVIHPGHQRNADGSVVHTGDSRNGSSAWDDERIFVFLDALAPSVTRLAFAVVSVNGRSFDTVAGAVCHVSDRLSDHQWARTDLTALSGLTSHVVAVVGRAHAGWSILSCEPAIEVAVHEHAQRLVRRGKCERASPHLQAHAATPGAD